MSEAGIDAYRVASVLGYCLLPMVGVGAVSVMVALEYASIPLYHPKKNRSEGSVLQRPNRLSPLPAFYHVVHIYRVRYFCRRPPHVGPASPRRVSRRLAIWVLCPVERVSRRQ
jgi:hypothetical protein